MSSLRPKPPHPSSPGYEAVYAWSVTIHGRGHNPRHLWALACAAAMDECGAGVPDLPPFPSARAHTRGTRDETVRRIYRTAEVATSA